MQNRLLLADDDLVFRVLIRELLTSREGWQICAEATDGAEAVEMAKRTSPDLAILDIAMPRRNGIIAARQIIEHSPTTIVLVISLYDPTVILNQIMDAGVRGFVSKASIGSELIPAVEALLRGETYFRVSQAYGA
jgi:DNA-binding NarL/FixJ family response regulator